MLVLTRKVGEYISIGDDVRVYVHRIDHNRVRLAIDAPKHIPIARSPKRRPDNGTDRPRRQDV